MLFPLLVVGIMYFSVGSGMLYSNSTRHESLLKEYNSNAIEFVTAEKQRVETFMNWYPIARYIMVILVIIGLISFVFWPSPIGRAIGIGLILLSLSDFVVDHFS